MEEKTTNWYASDAFWKWIILSMYVAGAIGMLIPAISQWFRLLTPFHLLFVGFYLFFDVQKTKRFFLFCAFVFTAGFFAEFIGVQYKVLFGEYSYGKTLGFGIGGVPLIMGVNWLVLIYSFIQLTLDFLGKNTSGLKVALIVATCMTLLDIVIEPVAIASDMWSWDMGVPPLQNFIGWWVASFVISWIGNNILDYASNPKVWYVLILHCIFFVVLAIGFYFL
ncbi:MAG: carotenoid biosynthesis protein [Leadbetterella sp.]